MKYLIILALVSGSLSVTNLAVAVESKLINQERKLQYAALLQTYAGGHATSEQKVIDSYYLPVKRGSSKSHHHNSIRHHRNNSRYRGGFSRSYGKHFRFNYGYSRKHGKFSRYGKGNSHLYGGHSKFNNGGIIRRHRNH